MRSISNRFFYAIVVLLNVFAAGSICAVSYTHLTLPTKLEV